MSADLQELGPDRTLLLVDDDEPFLKRLAKAMEKRGFEVEIAGSVAAGSKAPVPVQGSRCRTAALPILNLSTERLLGSPCDQLRGSRTGPWSRWSPLPMTS